MISTAQLAGILTIALAISPALGAVPVEASLRQAPAAATPGWQAAVARLFESGSAANATAVAAARSQYERLKRAAPNDRRLEYAYALVLINQRRYRDAEPLLAAFLQTKPAEPSAYCNEIWTLAQLHRYDEALVRAAALATLFGAANSAEPGLQEAADFLGAFFGYLELVRSPNLKIGRLADGKARIVAALGDVYRPAFDAARQAVAAQVAALKAEKQANEDEQLAAVEKDKKQAQAVLKKDESQIESHRRAIESSTEELQDGARQAAQLQRELAVLNNDRVIVAAQIAVVQGQLQQLTNSLMLNRPRAPTSMTTAALNTLVAQARATSLQLAALNTQAIQMDSKIMLYRRQIARLNLRGEQEVEMIAEREAAAAAKQRNAQSAERVLKRINKLTNTRSIALAQQMKLLSTYLPFAYAQESKRVLAWFAK